MDKKSTVISKKNSNFALEIKMIRYEKDFFRSYNAPFLAQ